MVRIMVDGHQNYCEWIRHDYYVYKQIYVYKHNNAITKE